MPQQGSPTITVRNFGPVKEGTFAVKPLTLFIGPNNSGKSYMALLVYALARALETRPQDIAVHAFSEGSQARYPELKEWLSAARHKKSEEAESFPPSLEQALQPDWEEYVQKLGEGIMVSLRDYFAYQDVRELFRREKGDSGLAVSILGGDDNIPLLKMRLEAEDNKRSVILATPELLLSPVRLERDDLKRIGLAFDLLSTNRIGDFLAQGIIQANWRAFLAKCEFLYSNSYYLPSARSGILQAWPLFASLALHTLRSRIGVERIEVPSLQGVTGEFLQLLLSILTTTPSDPEEEDKLRPVVDLLEGRIFQGQIDFAGTRPEQPQIVYTSGDVQLPLQRTSSMVAELAPLGLWLKYLLKPGDLLVIDEPEAHLHPENQRLVARVLVRLAKAGVRVICPTHSSLILHQVSNLILASQLSAEEREKQHLDLTEDDLISSEDVGVYLFDMQPDGTHIQPVEVDAEFGISEEEFIRVAEVISDETYRLALAANGKNSHA